jgi:hypothetical protein
MSPLGGGLCTDTLATDTASWLAEINGGDVEADKTEEYADKSRTRGRI